MRDYIFPFLCQCEDTCPDWIECQCNWMTESESMIVFEQRTSLPTGIHAFILYLDPLCRSSPDSLSHMFLFSHTLTLFSHFLFSLFTLKSSPFTFKKNTFFDTSWHSCKHANNYNTCCEVAKWWIHLQSCLEMHFEVSCFASL